MSVAKPQQGARVHRGHPMADGLVGFWAFNEGKSSPYVYDLSGNDNHGTLTDMDPETDWVASEQGGALDFGNNEAVDLGPTTWLNDSPMSLYAIWNKNDVTVQGRIFARGGADGNNPSLFVNARTVLGVVGNTQVNDGSGGGQVVGSGYPVSSGVWYHTALTLDNARLRLYVNGSLRQDDVAATDIGSGTATETWIGSRLNSSTTNFIGAVSFFSWYSRVFSASEVSALYHNPYAVLRAPTRTWFLPSVGGFPFPLVGPGGFVGARRGLAA